jgi:para-nitrobenzyl esterase
MKMHFFARILMLIFVFSLMTWTSVPAETENAPGASGDSQEDDWYRSSDITKDIDTDQTGAAGSSGNKSTSTGKEKESMNQNRKIVDDNYDRSLAVRCVNGTFVGKKSENIISYKGIPFVGRQPVGDLRWKAPVDVVPDNGVYEAYNYGKAPVQAPGDPAVAYGMGEDCLYLNIWKADEANAEKKPVIVWIYGGGFEVGGTADPQYDCYNLVKENPDVILVTIAYRVSFFGFLHLSHLPDGKDYQDASNLGLMDQIMALKWVHENIEGFGGDPDNVTLWGESAGGASVTLLPLVKGSHQYFKRVIAQSGAPAQTRTPEQAIAVTNRVMEALGCKTVSDLLKVSAQEFADTWARLYGFYQVLGIRTFPERDGNFLPLNPWEAYAAGAAKDITFLQGCNKDEMNTFLGAIGVDRWNEWANARKAEKLAQLTDKEKALVESYCNDIQGESYESTVRLFSQIMFIVPQIRLSEEQTRGGGKSYTYYFTPESAVPLIKCGHMIEVPAVFNHPEMQEFTGRAFDETFAKTMRRMWIQFAKTGDPSLSADISPDGKAKQWPLYDTDDKMVMVLDEKDIHPAKESELMIVDWDRTYFLSDYYMP